MKCSSRSWLSAAGAALVATVASLALAATANSAFSGGNGKIVFESTRDGNYEIYVMNADGTGLVNVSNNSADDHGPEWSPDGSKIVFSSFRVAAGNEEIYVMNADGSSPTRLTTDPSGDFSPTWSPDGTRIAFTSVRDGNAEIYVMNADGTGQVNRTNSAGTADERAAWSTAWPFNKIAFDTNRGTGGNREIYLMNSDGTAQTNLTNHSAEDFSPNYSPDGTKIAFDTTRGTSSNKEIFTMNADGTAQTNRTSNAAQDFRPAWSPQGDQISFDRLSGNNDIWTMNADGTAQTNRTAHVSHDAAPDWGPVARTFARPQAATPQYYSLVVAYRECTAPNGIHNGNIFPPPQSCYPAQATSDFLTVGTPDFNAVPSKAAGSINIRVRCIGGASGEVPPCSTTAGDQLDGQIVVSQRDVRCSGTSTGCAAPLADYTGSLLVEPVVRITDRNGYGLGGATVEDMPMPFTVPCNPTGDATIGSTCSLTTTIDTLLGGNGIIENKRAIWQVEDLSVHDGGTDGDANTTGDNTLYMKTGVFFP
jgi:hypothetical protein